jgi:hypothetical protein
VTSERKIRANRANARASTGPKTARGRSRAARNALRHALLAQFSAVVGTYRRACASPASLRWSVAPRSGSRALHLRQQNGDQASLSICECVNLRVAPRRSTKIDFCSRSQSFPRKNKYRIVRAEELMSYDPRTGPADYFDCRCPSVQRLSSADIVPMNERKGS